MLSINELLNPEPAQASSSTDADTTGVQTEVQEKKCSECPHPAEKDKVKCRCCLDWQNEQGKKRRETLKNQKRCQRCPEELDRDSGGLCTKCFTKKQKYDASR